MLVGRALKPLTQTKNFKLRLRGATAESFVLIAIIALLVISQYSLPPTIQQSVTIASAIFLGLGGVDILVAIAMTLRRYFSALAAPVPASPQQKIGWKNLPCLGSQDGEIRNHFVQALENQEIANPGYKAILFRAADDTHPALISYDGVGADLKFNSPNAGKNNLSNYQSNEVLFVTFFVRDKNFEKCVMKDPYHGAHSAWFQNCTYVHLNSHDITNLIKHQKLLTQVRWAIENYRIWKSEYLQLHLSNIFYLSGKKVAHGVKLRLVIKCTSL